MVSEGTKPTCTRLAPEVLAELDALAAQLARQFKVPVSRSAALRRALDVGLQFLLRKQAPEVRS